jgi:hypothetical protein
MNRDALQGLSRDELIELVVRLGEMVMAAGQQPERIAELERQLAELQAEVERLSAPPKTSENSSVPPPRSSGQAAGSRRIGRSDDDVGVGSGAGIRGRVDVGSSPT